MRETGHPDSRGQGGGRAETQLIVEICSVRLHRLVIYTNFIYFTSLRQIAIA